MHTRLSNCHGRISQIHCKAEKYTDIETAPFSNFIANWYKFDIWTDSNMKRSNPVENPYRICHFISIFTIHMIEVENQWKAGCTRAVVISSPVTSGYDIAKCQLVNIYRVKIYLSES